MDEQNVPTRKYLAARLSALITGLILVNSAHGLDEETFDIVCEVTQLCDSSQVPGLGNDLGNTDFGTSLSPIVNGVESVLTISSNTTSKETIEDRLAALRQDTMEVGSVHFRDRSLNTTHISAHSDRQYLQRGGGASADNPFYSHWGIFGSVKYTDGERKDVSLDTGRVESDNFFAGGDLPLGFEYSSANVSAGIDYKLTPNLIIGLAGSYTFKESEGISTGSRTETDEVLFTIFSSFYNDSGFYLDALLGAGAGKTYYDRTFGFSTTVNNAPIEFSTVGAANTDTTPINASLGMGLNKYIGAWTLAPFLQVNWLQNDIAGYQESPTGINTNFPEGIPSGFDPDIILLANFFAQEVARNFLLDVDVQSLRSLTSVFGSDFSRAINMSWGVITPKLSVSWVKEYEEPEDIISRFIATVGEAGADFLTEIPEFDDSYFNVGLGLTATHRNNFVSFITFDAILGSSDIEQTTVNLGIRKEF